MRLEAVGMGYRVRGGGLGAWIAQGGGAGQCPGPTLPSPSPVRLLQTKNMDYYKREVSGARGGGSSGGHELPGTPTSPLRLAPDRVLQEGHGQDQGEILHLP